MIRHTFEGSKYSPLRQMWALEQRTDDMRTYPSGWETIKLFVARHFATMYADRFPDAGYRVTETWREIFD